MSNLSNARFPCRFPAARLAGNMFSCRPAPARRCKPLPENDFMPPARGFSAPAAKFSPVFPVQQGRPLCPLPSGSEAAGGKTGKRALLFGSPSTLGSPKQTATAGSGVFGIAGLFLERLRALAAQFLQTCADRGKVVGSAGSVHVPSP